MITSALLVGLTPTFARENPSREFLVFSDLHYDGGSKYATKDLMGHDANPDLIQSAFASATNVLKTPLFVLCLGDSLPHGENGGKAPGRIAELTNEFQKYFGNTPVFAVLGNNDSERDYQIQSPAFLHSFTNAWVPAKYAYYVSSHGWYAANLPGLANCRLLALNSSYFSVRCDPSSERDTGAANQLNWVMSEIQRARAEKASLWLAFHVPPVRNPVDTKKHLWNQDLEREFLGMVATNSDVIKAVFCSHIHRDEFRVIYNGSTPTSFIHIAPSVCPVYLNNPGYQVFSSGPAGDILDYQTFYRPLSTKPSSDEWTTTESFTAKFGVADMTPKSLDAIRNNLIHKSSFKGKSLKDVYLANYSVESMAATMPPALNFEAYVAQMGLTNSPAEAKAP